jgi:hypothetical protein
MFYSVKGSRSPDIHQRRWCSAAESTHLRSRFLPLTQGRTNCTGG